MLRILQLGQMERPFTLVLVNTYTLEMTSIHGKIFYHTIQNVYHIITKNKMLLKCFSSKGQELTTECFIIKIFPFVITIRFSLQVLTII